MGPAKRVQASLSSFFKVKAQTKDEDTGGKKDENTELGSANKQADKRKRRRTVDSDEEYLSSHSTSSDDKAAKLHKGTGGRAQSKGHTLVKSVSDTADLMQRLRMRAKEKEGGIQPTPEIKHSLLATSGTVEGTHVQLVERAPGIKYTPLEMQVLDAKRAHPDMLLAVEVGYKFRFFGEDARIASRVLGIMCTMANNFYNASVPTPRLMIHVQRLVHAGYKVGVLRQVETAALKAVSDNKGAPFTRELSEVFTTGTMVDAVDASAPNERFLMCVVERLIDAADKRVSMAMLAVQVTTGSVVYDEFEDGYLRGALETRLAHLQPGELLVPPGLSAETLRTLTAYAGYPIDTSERPEPLLEHANRTSVRVAFANAELLEPSMARSLATDFYANNDTALLPSVLELPEAVVVALALMLDYLRPFKLDRALLAAPLFLPFHTQTHMLLSATALQTLSVFTVGAAGSDSDDAVQLKELLKPGGRPGGVRGGGDGSLFGVMDFTRTQFGRRLLRRWVAHPLISKDSLTDRTDAVEYLKNVLNDADSIEDPNRRTIAGMHGKLAQLVDLERGLCRIHYAQAGPQELLRILRSLETAIALVPPGFDLTEPRLLADVLGADTWSTDLRDSINAWRSQIDYASAKRGHRETLFTHGALFDHVQTHHDAVASVENELQEHRAEVSRELGDPAFEFKSVSGIDYLIDVRNARAKTVPASWIKVSGTKTHSRFHTPFIAERLRERDRCRESLQKAARDAYARFLREISEKYAALRRVIVALATLDALFSLAVLARQAGYSRPELIDSPEASVDLAGAVNPILGPQSAEFVANDIVLGTDSARAMVLTGPNAGGKSTLVRTVALIAIMAQCGAYVPARRARLSIVDAVVARMGASDNLMRGESTFMVEMRETAELLRHVSPRSLAILDELGRGTSTHDGAAIAFAVLSHLVHERPLVFFVTHYAHLVDAFAADARVRSCHMAFLEQQTSEADSDKTRPEQASEANDDVARLEQQSSQIHDDIADIIFLYKLVRGASVDSFGLNVARLAGLPEPLLRRARERARWMRTELDSKWAARSARQLQFTVAQARLGLSE